MNLKKEGLDKISTKWTANETKQDEGTSSKGVTLTKRLFPAGFTSELRKLLCLAWPVALSSLLTFLPSPVALMFCGHLGKNELDAVALATSVLNLTGIFLCIGLSTACDTLFSQAYGGKKMKLIIVYFQRSLIIITLSCFICWSVQLNAEKLLILLHQDPLISRLAADYMLFFMPGLMCNFIYQVAVKFLQTQDIVIPTVLLGLIGNVFNVLAHYVLVYVCDLGIRGSAVAVSVSWLISCLTSIVYISRTATLRDNWEGWSWEALEEWASFVKLALAGLAMIAGEWCLFEGGIFLNGLLGVVQQGAISVTFQIDWFLYMIILGFAIACSIRVGQNLGSGDSAGAKTSYRVAQLATGCLNLVTTTLLIALRYQIPLIFTSDKEVRDLVSDIIPVIGIVQILDVFTGISAGALRGCGLQWIGGVLNFLGYFVIGLPASTAFMFYSKLGALGFWWGITAGIVPICVAYLIIMVALNWDNQARKAVSINNKSESNSVTEVKDNTRDKSYQAVMMKTCSGAIPTSVGSENSNLLVRRDKGLCSADRRRLTIKCSISCGVVLAIFVGGVVIRVMAP